MSFLNIYIPDKDTEEKKLYNEIKKAAEFAVEKLKLKKYDDWPMNNKYYHSLTIRLVNEDDFLRTSLFRYDGEGGCITNPVICLCYTCNTNCCYDDVKKERYNFYYKNNKDNGTSATQTVAGSVFHEMGHAWAYQHCMQDSKQYPKYGPEVDAVFLTKLLPKLKNELFDNAYEAFIRETEANKTYIKEHVSPYAACNISEFFSEVIARRLEYDFFTNDNTSKEIRKHYIKYDTDDILFDNGFIKY